MRHAFDVQVGPVAFRVGSEWPGPIAALRQVYAGYPSAARTPDFTVRLEAEKPWRRWLRPSVAIRGDYTLPDAVPVALEHGLLAAEMGMNLQMALGQRRFLLLHAASVEREGRALILTGISGAGKSTLSALLGERGWRLLGDEFALLEPQTGLLHPFPRPISLKNGSIAVMAREVAADRFGPQLDGTPKGSIRHVRPRADALERMTESARPGLILFPRFGHDRAVRPIGAAETFVRLTQASTNYVAMGEAGFDALTRLVQTVPARAIDYPDTEGAIALVEQALGGTRLMRAAELLVALLVEPGRAADLTGEQWTATLAAARAENLLGSLAWRLEPMRVPPAIARILAEARTAAAESRRIALWEAEMARRALGSLGLKPILLKGAAFAAADLEAGQGRSIGDLDILVPRDTLDRVAQALRAAGWEWVKDDEYDQTYYRTWMHELPPLIHRDRDRMIDVHHTILPLTAGPTPDADALIADSVALPGGLRTLSPADMVVHAAAHLFADGDLAGGLRNLWDIDRLLREHDGDTFRTRLGERARLHGLLPAVARALRLTRAIYATPIDPLLAGRASPMDAFFRRRLLARDEWGRERRPLLRFGFYVRSHWMRMPPALLARHLLIKATKRR